MSDEESDHHETGQAGTEEEYLPFSDDIKSDISNMHSFLAGFKRLSLVIEEVIPIIEERLYYWLNKGDEELSETFIENLPIATTTASSLSKVVESESDERSPEFYEDLLALINLLDLMRED